MKRIVNRKILAVVSAAAILSAVLGFCGTDSSETLEIVSGSENETPEPFIQEFARENGCRINVHDKGLVDMMLEMSDDAFPYDAVWPANSLWISLEADAKASGDPMDARGSRT